MTVGTVTSVRAIVRSAGGGVAAALLTLALAPTQASAAPPSGPAQATPRSTGAPVPRAPDPAPAHAAPAPDADVGTRSVAARARMSECGHQWNNMKRTGTATGTWKEFSRNCLAQK